jgi:hypothetical protein
MTYRRCTQVLADPGLYVFTGVRSSPGHDASARIAQALGMAPTAELDAEGERIWIGTP